MAQLHEVSWLVSSGLDLGKSFHYHEYFLSGFNLDV
jgi:hypothetical protein